MPTSFPLYPRSCAVQVGGVVIPADPATGFHVHFRIKRGVHVSRTAVKPHPNTCDLKIWNLAESTRKRIELSTPKTPAAGPIVPVVISAGYKDHRCNVFNGQLHAAGTKSLSGGGCVTELTTGDGTSALVQRMNVSLGKGTTARAAMQAIVSGLGIGAGNLARALSLVDSSALAGQLYARGAVLKGPAPDIMTDLCRSLGLTWSIQDGALSLRLLNEPLDGEATLIDAAHGMQGSPSVDTLGILTVSTAMIPGIVPGSKLSMNADTVTGGWVVIGVETTGDNFENEWCHRIEASRY